MNLIALIIFSIVFIDGEAANYLTEIIIGFFAILIGIVLGSYIVIKRYKKHVD